MSSAAAGEKLSGIFARRRGRLRRKFFAEEQIFSRVAFDARRGGGGEKRRPDFFHGGARSALPMGSARAPACCFRRPRRKSVSRGGAPNGEPLRAAGPLPGGGAGHSTRGACATHRQLNRSG